MKALGGTRVERRSSDLVGVLALGTHARAPSGRDAPGSSVPPCSPPERVCSATRPDYDTVVMLAFDAGPPPLQEDPHGVIRVGGTRVSLESVVMAFDRGASAEEIVESFPSLDLAAVYATLAYVLQERVRVDEYLVQREQQLAEIREEVERSFPATGLRARLLARRQGTAT